MNAHEKTKDYGGNTLNLIIKLHNTELVLIKFIKQISCTNKWTQRKHYSRNNIIKKASENKYEDDSSIHYTFKNDQ